MMPRERQRLPCTVLHYDLWTGHTVGRRLEHTVCKAMGVRTCCMQRLVAVNHYHRSIRRKLHSTTSICAKQVETLAS